MKHCICIKLIYTKEMTHVVKIIGEEGVSGLKQDLHQDMVQKDAWGVQNKLAKDLNPTEMLWVNQAVHARKLTTVAHLAELAAHMRKTCRGPDHFLHISPLTHTTKMPNLFCFVLFLNKGSFSKVSCKSSVSCNSTVQLVVTVVNAMARFVQVSNWWWH